MVTTENTSDTLKAALADRSFGDYNTINDLRTWWHNGDAFTYMGTMFGLVKALSDTAKPRLFEPSDGDIIRAWSAAEILNFLSSNLQYVNHEFSTVNGGLSRRCTITVTDGESNAEFSADQLIGTLAQEPADLEAFALALVELLEDASFTDYLL